MPIKIVEGLPICKELKREQIVTMDESTARTQDIRPLKILILNLMPKKETTELQLLRLLGNTPLQIEVDLMYTATYEASNTPISHLNQYYKTFDEIKDQQYDGLIITGAPVEQFEYNEVNYIDELKTILDWSQKNAFSRLFICWGAQYALNYFYGIDNYKLEQKLFGIYEYDVLEADQPLLRGFNDTYQVPQSRHTSISIETIQAQKDLRITTKHPEFGPDIITTTDNLDIFLLGHLEYDRETLHQEYQRDKEAGSKIALPENYYPGDDDSKTPKFTWKSNAFLLYNNWLNEVYQHTYYNLKDILKEDK
ncbi:homoserine O-succinyltransferase [Aerococcaceae bacterium INB8]|uniref:Homoserine O-acetyltransferase n=1 Tax=Ruoffia halotolerans TaxID=2748684 RepID=A0A839A503_9LACT|nr:homoserine O-succinyltransferase [Ruoffia halotolerans]MBA5728924.1 homoserine O-succinyltransferase [Ruoffia halotolerans]